MRLVQVSTGRVLAEHLQVPRTFLGRAWGLMLRSGLDEGQGMWIKPCASIHTFWMRFPVDAVFLDRRLRVVRIIAGLRPYRVVLPVRFAQSVVELPSGSGAGLQVGDQLELESAESGR